MAESLGGPRSREGCAMPGPQLGMGFCASWGRGDLCPLLRP